MHDPSFETTASASAELFHGAVRGGTPNAAPEHFEKVATFLRETDDLQAQLSGALDGTYSLSVDESGVHCHARSVPPEWGRIVAAGTVSPPSETASDLVSVDECRRLLEALNDGSGFLKAEAASAFGWAHSIRLRRCLLDLASSGDVVIDATVTPFRFYATVFGPAAGLAA